MDWNQFYRDLQGPLTQLVLLLLGLAGTWVMVKQGQLKQAEIEREQLEKGKQVASIAVAAAIQSDKVANTGDPLTDNAEMKQYAMEAMAQTVPKLGNHLHEKLVESAVLDMHTKKIADTLDVKASDAASPSTEVLDMENAG